MSTSSSHRHRTITRKLAISAAALLVTVLPTACDDAYADQPAQPAPAPAGSAPGGHSRHGVSHTETVIVPAGNSAARTQASTTTASPPPRAGSTPPRAGSTPPRNGSTPSPTSTSPSAAAEPTNEPTTNPADEPDPTPTATPPPATPTAPATNGLTILGDDCTDSALPPHDGFQLAPRCVDIAFGEVAAEDRSPSLLITAAPRAVRARQTFTISVSTRNLVRDRFLGAAAGGYYLESSFLDEDGLQRGHFHTACRMLASTDVAPDAAPAPAFFVATQDNGGGATPDTVAVTIPGLPAAGTAQCAVWAGDGSHRLPMMQRANQTPAFDAVRIRVR